MEPEMETDDYEPASYEGCACCDEIVLLPMDEVLCEDCKENDEPESGTGAGAV